MFDVKTLSPELPVLIAGPTASGKSALAMEIASTQGGVIINADALQVYENWRILTARPSKEDEAATPHALYGHIAHDQEYSVGQWLREIAPYLQADARPIVVGGTGLYFSALTEGLAEIPPTPPAVRAIADARRMAEGGHKELFSELEKEDPETARKIDKYNPMRVQRAWEVLHATGRGIASWQADTPPPLLPLSQAQPLVLDAEKSWLSSRIEQRFETMVNTGALEEVKENIPSWSPDLPSSKAIGASELVAFLQDKKPLEVAIEASIIATKQYAKRQRTWFRSRMKDYIHISMP